MPVITFNPDDHSPETLRLIMLRVEQWGVSPAEAIIRLLDELVASQKKSAA
jgi:hypothetical protein